MLSPLKHRLIGTVVLIALLVIILPDLFDGQKDPVKEQFNTIPFAPEPAGEKPLVINLDDNGKTPAQRTIAQSAQPQPSKATTDDDPQTSEFSDAAWVIQLATLKSASGTNALIQKLRDAGFQAHSYPRTPKDGELNRIFVGPDVSKSALEAKLSELKKLTGLKGLVRHFEPLAQ